MRKISRPQHHRIRRILEMIRRGTRTGVYPNAKDFMRELEVSWSTAIRDLNFLRDDDRAPIEYDASKKGYYLTDETWELSPISLSRKELFAFSVAQKLIGSFRGTPLEVDVQSVFSKIACSMQGKVTIDPDLLTDKIMVIAEDHVLLDTEVWTTVVKCAERGDCIRIAYQKFDGQTKEYFLEPWHLLVYHGNWYVLGRRVGEVIPPSLREPRRATSDRLSVISGERQGNRGPMQERDHRDGDHRGSDNVSDTVHDKVTGGAERPVTFAVSRIRKIERTGESFEVPSWFEPQKHIEASFGIVRGDKVFKVRLLFAPKISTYIQERQWHPTQKIVRRRDGSIELSFETAGWKELVRWILSWQPDVKVLSPKRLRERIEVKMRQALGTV